MALRIEAQLLLRLRRNPGHPAASLSDLRHPFANRLVVGVDAPLCDQAIFHLDTHGNRGAPGIFRQQFASPRVGSLGHAEKKHNRAAAMGLVDGQCLVRDQCEITPPTLAHGLASFDNIAQ